MNVKDCSSDSDQSDKDFIPENEEESDVSVEESVEDSDVSNDEEITRKNDIKKRQKSKFKTRDKNKKIKTNTKRINVTTHENNTEETKLCNVEEEKQKADALWADFLNDSKNVNSISPFASSTENNSKTANITVKPEKIKVTHILDFIGEEVKIEKEISPEEMQTFSKSEKTTAINLNESSTPKPRELIKNSPFGNPSFSMKRSITGSSSSRTSGGLNAILGQIGKKKKMSVLEKTKVDWDNFKEKEGISEELATFNRGKDG